MLTSRRIDRAGSRGRT